MTIARSIGLEPGEEDARYPQGRNPLTMTREELAALGHRPMSFSQVVRAKCLDCAAGSATEVRRCPAVECPSWPYRLGRSPFRADPSPAQLEARAKAAARLAATRSAPSVRCASGAADLPDDAQDPLSASPQ